MDKCPNCGQITENGIDKCPNCGNALTKKNVIEEVQVDPNSVISLDDEQNIEEIETLVEPPQTSNEPEQTIEQNPVEPESTHIQEEPQPIEETNVVNDSLEIVTTNAEELKFEEDIPKQTIIEIPEMPEPTIGEINPNLLGDQYDEEERINNEKIEAKHQQELAELERKRQEEEAKKQAAAQAGKPDLLAGRSNEELNMSTKLKKKKGKIGKIILILLILAIIAFGLYYFLVLEKK